MSKSALFAHSYSRLAEWRNCAYMAYHKFVLRTVRFEENDAAKEGTRIHEAFAKRLKTGNELPADLKRFEPMLWDLLLQPGEMFVEHDMTLDVNLQPCAATDWDNAFIRAKQDVIIVNGTVGWMGDWKSGKPKPDETQLRMASLLGFELFPQVDRWTTSYIWVMYNNKPDTESYDREDREKLWEPLFEEFQQIQEMYIKGHWPANPKATWVCKYCAVNKVGQCEFAKVPYGGD